MITYPERSGLKSESGQEFVWRYLHHLLPLASSLMKEYADLILSVLRSGNQEQDWSPDLIHSFIHSGHFYSAPSSPLLLRGAPDYSTDTVSEFHAEAHRQLQVKDLPKVPT